MRHSKLMALAIAVPVLISGPGSAARSETLVERGAYLVNGIGSCGNCHSPQEPDGTLTGAPFSGGPAITSPAFTVTPPNLTSDPETGLGRWTEAQIVTALREGLRPDGRMLRPPRPIALYRSMSDRDAAAIAAYLKTLPPTESHVPPAEYHVPVPASYGPPIAGIGAPNPADQIETGRYLEEIGHCMLCHTPLNAARQPDFARQFGAGGLVLPEAQACGASDHLHGRGQRCARPGVAAGRGEFPGTASPEGGRRVRPGQRVEVWLIPLVSASGTAWPGCAPHPAGRDPPPP